MTRTGDREIRSVSGRLPDNPGELACMQYLYYNYYKEIKNNYYAIFWGVNKVYYGI